MIVWLLVAAAAALLAAPAHGAQKGVTTDLTWGLDQATKDRVGAAVADLGAQWVTIDVSWRNAETSQGVFDEANLADIDRAIVTARAAGASVVMTVSETPQWASGHADSRFPPANAAHFAAFLQMAVVRWAPSVDAWQVWNEPNHPSFWQPDPTGNPNACAEYAPLLKAAYPAIKAGDPTARVLFGGLAFNDYPYVERCFDLVPDIGAFFDVMVTHPYAMGGLAPETAKDTQPADGRLDHQTFLAYREMRNTLLARGHDKPIWFTEMGWSTATDGHVLGNVTPETQADYLTRAYRLLEQDPYVEVALWYSLRNVVSMNDGPGWLAQLGLMRTDFTPKPAYFAFKAYEPAAAAPVVTPGAPPAGTVEATGKRSSLTLSVRRMAARTRAARIARTQTVRISGRLSGARTGRVTIRLQRRAGTKWVYAKRVRITSSATGRINRLVRLPRGRRWRARAQYDGSSAIAPSKSRYVTFATQRLR